jgi:hypothetical protein
VTPATAAARTALLTTFAMLAFASNSLLCRIALRDTSIDAASFTSIRLASGALVLWVLLRSRGRLRDTPSASHCPSSDSPASAAAGE